MVPSRSSAHDGADIFTWLDEVRTRPEMFAKTLSDLESQIWGYYAALDMHRVNEPVPSMRRHFMQWVEYRTRWSVSCGWASAIEAKVPQPVSKQFAKFFRLLDEYRQLVPRVLCSVQLSAKHEPTGKRVVYGLDGRMERPHRVDVVRYLPAPLHFIRLHYPQRVEDRGLLHLPDGSYETTILDAKRWVADELQVKRAEWQRMA